MRYFFKITSACAVMFAVTSCGSEGQGPDLTDQLVGTLKSTFQQRRAAGQPQAAAAVTRTQIEQSTVPLLRLTLGETGSQATAAELARNGDTTTYFMGTGQAIYLRGGLLTGTRGLGYDLMSLDMPHRSVAAALNAGGSYTRVHRYLNSESRLTILTATCSMRLVQTRMLTQVDRQYKVRHVVENCVGSDGMRFENSYDLDARSNQVWRSRQWVGPVAEHALIEQLKP